jgi:hypothetical protein
MQAYTICIMMRATIVLLYDKYSSGASTECVIAAHVDKQM